MQPKKRGRRKGSKNKDDPKLTQMLGDATFHYARGDYDQACYSVMWQSLASGNGFC